MNNIKKEVRQRIRSTDVTDGIPMEEGRRKKGRIGELKRGRNGY